MRNPDFTTARRIARAVNAFVGEASARVSDPGTVELRVPASYQKAVVDLLTDVEQLRVEPDQTAKIVIDEKAGIIVMGENVRISTVAIAQGNLTIRITETPQVSQPQPFSNTGTTAIVWQAAPEAFLGEELVSGVSALGISPRDMISILQAIKAAGALQAEIEVL